MMEECMKPSGNRGLESSFHNDDSSIQQIYNFPYFWEGGKKMRAKIKV